MISSTTNTVQVRVESLIHYYACLGQAMFETGVTDCQRAELFSKCVLAECTHCRIRVTGDEVLSIASGEAHSDFSDPKLERLRLGRCARAGCGSSSYFVHFGSFPGVDWRAVSERAFRRVTAMALTASEQQKLLKMREKRARHGRLWKVAATD